MGGLNYDDGCMQLRQNLPFLFKIYILMGFSFSAQI